MMTTNHPDPTPPPAEPAPSLRPVEEITADVATLAEHERVYAHLRGRPDTNGLSDVGMARHRLAGDVPALEARLRAAEETLARVEAALHLNDWEPINPPDEPGGYTTAYVSGWDDAVDHMHDLARAALAEGASR